MEHANRRRRIENCLWGLLANANAGGDNVHRGMLLGAVLGASVDAMPESLTEGLADHRALGEEITAFADIAAGGKGI